MSRSACKGCGAPIEQPKGSGRRREWCSDRCRKSQYAGTCDTCGSATNGYNGHGSASSRCLSCYLDEHTRHERNEKLVEFWEAGVPAADIGRKLGMTQRAVGNWVYQQRRRKGRDLSRRFLPRDRKVPRFEYIGRRLREGALPAEIASELGTSPGSVRNMIYRARREGFEMPRREAVAA